MADSVDQLRTTLSGSYTFERELGGGGMSRVFLAREVALGRDVVIKVLTTTLSQDVSAERFAREIQVAAALQQANIVPLLATGTADGIPYYVMPYVQGESLRARLIQQPKLTIAECIGILRDVARALNYAHARGVVHRDIKPDNILLSGDTAVVTDFGIAKAVSAARTAAEPANLTQTGTSLGTPAYMAPEQIAGDPMVDNRADIYAWGVVAWEILGGKHPFADRTSPQAMIAAHMSTTAPSVTTLRPDTPAALSDLIRRCLEKDPSKRPGSAAELLQSLDSVSGGGSSRRTTLIWSSAAALVAVAVLIAGLYFVRAGSAGSPNVGNSSEVKSIAVLPIENLGGDSTTEYLADGMTSELSSALTKIPGLQVTADLSASRFKNKHVDP
ncbi:MAG: serine/threonine-protein kinase, partial [Gemmatimonadaceae bacterium]